MEETVERLGGLDDLVYSTGLISIIALADADESMWHRTLGTNVVGASLLTQGRAATPAPLQGDRGLPLLRVERRRGVARDRCLHIQQGCAQSHDRDLALRAPRGRLHPDSRRPYRGCRDRSRVPPGSAATHVSPRRDGGPLGCTISSELRGGGGIARPGRGVADLGRDRATYGSAAPLAAISSRGEGVGVRSRAGHPARLRRLDSAVVSAGRPVPAISRCRRGRWRSRR